MKESVKSALTKVPAVTLVFWFIKILATTLGETAGDAVSMSWLGETTNDAPTSFWQGGYLIGTGIFASVLVALVFFQIRARRFHPALYWATIIASTTAGTTMADFATRPLGAVVGDFLDKPPVKGGLELSRVGASAVLMITIVALVMMTRQRAAAVEHG